MSVLSRPVLHHASAPTQREARIPLPRDASPAEAVARTEPAVGAPTPAPPAPAPRRRPAALILAGGLAALAVIGGATYLLTNDDGGAAQVIAPAYVPTQADLARDQAAAARGPVSTSSGVDDNGRSTAAQREAALQQRAQSQRAQDLSP